MAKTRLNLITQAIEQEIARFKLVPQAKDVGEILELGDGIAQVGGLSETRLGEIVEFPQTTYGLAFNLSRQQVGIIILGPYTHLREGDTVKATGKLLSVAVGPGLISRVIDPLGNPLDSKPAPNLKTSLPLEYIAPGVITREPVNTPLQTGIKAIDAMIPIGRGQRELIIGDRGIGKSAIALTTIINQKGQGVTCIYVAIGQKAAFIAQTIATLRHFGALDHTIIVAADASTSAALQYLAPYSGTAIGEYFAQNGQDALIVYDDLSKHAWAYRELSLLLRRPSGREAYPGDIFYLHSRLLERAVKFNTKNGGGSLTALPIIETQAGDLSAYIPTNVISITDGQIYLEPDLFYAGTRPAINVGLSVSRVGGNAQIKAMKQVAGRLRLDLAQYRELAAFAQFSSDLDPQTKAILDRGSRLSEILKQGWDELWPVIDQILVIWAVTHGFADAVSLDKIKVWQDKFRDYVHTQAQELLKTIDSEKELTGKTATSLTKLATKFNQINPQYVQP
ncbi:MAG: F0F1 ATP synthase subunit alpha [Candidatus Chisholmbacteria bacterium]|nr:F0F1 ATP synthase subunit alpha [Candidatus Chisholmbacteria bacterium]